MTNSVVVDTSTLVALIDARDKWHSVAVDLRDALKSVRAKVLYFDPVINETVGVLSRRLSEQRRIDQFAAALDILEEHVPPAKIIWVSSETLRLYPQIMALVRENKGNLNFHDALIALISRELGVNYVASFDSGFDHVSWLKRVARSEDVQLLMPS